MSKIDQIDAEIKKVSEADKQVVADRLKDGLDREDIMPLVGVAVRNWKIIAAILAICGLIGGATIGHIGTKADVDLGKAIADGFERQAKLTAESTQQIVRAIEAKPVPGPTPDAGALPAEIKAQVGRMVKVSSREAGLWVVPPNSPCDWHSENKTLTIVPTAEKDFPVGMVAGNKISWCFVRAGAVGPINPPDPPVPPKPITSQKLWIVVIEETADATAARAALWTDEALSKRMAEKGHRKRLLDKDTISKSGQPDRAVKSFLDRAQGKQLPYLVLTDMDGTVVWEGAFPQTAPALIELLGKVGG